MDSCFTLFGACQHGVANPYILHLLYYFGTVGLNRSDMMSIFSMVLPMRLCTDGLAIYIHCISLRDINITLGAPCPLKQLMWQCNFAINLRSHLSAGAF